MLKMFALGTLGYVAYRYIKSADRTARDGPALRLAGGPLSDRARIQSTPDLLPATE